MSDWLTGSQHYELTQYVRVLADLLALKDWRFEVARTWAGGGETYAQILPVEGRRFARVLVTPEFFASSLDEQRDTIAHELVHCHNQNALDVVQCDLRRSRCLSEGELRLVLRGLDRQLEYATDALAAMVSPHLPLPAWSWC